MCRVGQVHGAGVAALNLSVLHAFGSRSSILCRFDCGEKFRGMGNKIAYVSRELFDHDFLDYNCGN